MKRLTSQVKESIESVVKRMSLKGDVVVDKTKIFDNGHFTTNFPLMNAKNNGKTPMELGGLLVDELNSEKLFEKVEIVKPGFINFWINKIEIFKVIDDVLVNKDNFGRGKNKNFSYNLELVSANPTGYLHIGHARNGVIGDAMRRILEFNGYDVSVDYYTNDAGNQINVLACTMYYNYLQKLGIEVETPEEMYGGDIYGEVVMNFIKEYGDSLKGSTISNNRISDEKTHELFKTKSIKYFLIAIKEQLNDLDVKIDYYSSEKEMYDNNEIEKTLKQYEKLGATYEKDGALWLETTKYDDDKDRVLIKQDKTYTYILPDLACHNVRFERIKANKYVNYWGGDHHGYISRMRAGLALLGNPYDILDIEMIQMVRLMKDGQEYKMSKRRGTAVWLVDLMEMIGKDSIRYMLSSKSPSTHMDFDLDLAVSKNSTNPVYYAQYATARANKLIEKANLLNISSSIINKLDSQKEIEIILLLDAFESQINYAVKSRLPSVICDYIQSLSKSFHSYYSDTTIVDESDKELSAQRVCLVKSVLQVLENAFNLIGIEPKKSM